MSQRNDYTALAGQTVFTYTFQIFEDSEIQVYQNGTLLTLTTDYTVANATLPTIGGTITLVNPATVGDAIALVQNIPITRLITYITDGDWKATDVNSDFNRIYTLLVQAFGTGTNPNDTISDRLIRFAESVDRSLATNLYPTPQDGFVLGWDSNGDLQNISLTVGTTDVQFLTLISQLKPLDVSTNSDAFCLGKVSALDGFQNRFWYDPTSTATPDDELVIKPDSVILPDPGRWLAVQAGTAGIEDEGITTNKLSDNAVTTEKVLDASLTKPKNVWLPFQSIEGLKTTNNSGDLQHDIDIATGNIMDSTDTYLLRLQSAFTKQIDATFAVGTNLGGLSNQESLSADTCYGIFLIGKSTDPTDCDVIFATTEANALADTVAVAAGFDIARLIEYVWTNGTSNLNIFFRQGNGLTVWSSVDDITSTVSGAGVLVSAQVPPFQNGIFTYTLSSNSGINPSRGLLTNSDATNQDPIGTNYDVIVGADSGLADTYYSTIKKELKVDGSSQIRHRENNGIGVQLSCWAYRMDYSITDLV